MPDIDALQQAEAEARVPADWALELAAQAWCDPETEDRVMDAALAIAFAKRLEAERARAAAVVEAALYWQGHGGHPHWCDEPCDCGRTPLLAALAAYQRGGQ